ncbi:hypothetical protein H072_11260 [Dactylellina haptotyla CBS 200.50]|uniref:FZ domain-containing protein n=1 Tax=Dactylellina haptotyla (strain CBS 200.50) TaxID=1284197 RepID=S8BJK6_DACHA|nr:hypothetical protein H072_11260 [Dactylellina haptotyla CBS 200.50]
MVFRVPCPRLTPLQSRVAISSFATVIMITLLVLWTLPPSAYSQTIPDLGGGHRLHHVHPRSPAAAAEEEEGQSPVLDDGMVGGFFNPIIESTEGWPDTTSPLDDDAPPHDMLPGILEERQGTSLFALEVERNQNWNLKPGEGQLFGVDTDQIFLDAGKPGSPNVFTDLEKNVRARTVYITFNLCWSPTPNPSNSTTKRPTTELVVYASNSNQNKAPGPLANPAQQAIVPFIEGFANVTLNASSTIYFSVFAPNITGNFTDLYNFNMVASTKQPYWGYHNYQHMYLIDTDSSSALLISGNETSYSRSTNISDIVPPYSFFAHQANDTALNGFRRSWCGLNHLAGLSSINGQVSMTRRGLGNKVKEQVYLTALQPNTTYSVWLTKQINNTVGGGFVYSAVNLTTKSDGNCRVIFDLNFCSEVAYAVPTNTTIFPDMPFLAKFYDTYASSWYANFSYSLQQVQCNTTDDRAYSHLRSCEDCDKAYRTWLCATTIPRCEDYSTNAPYLAIRERPPGEDRGPTKIFLEDGRIAELASDDGTQSKADEMQEMFGVFKPASRNALIDEVVSPGPYKEIKPCMDLCWSLVQSCPASLGFGCPDGARGEKSYGWRNDDGDITCSYLGAAYFLSGATRGLGGPGAAVGLAVAAAVMVMIGVVL